MNLSDILKINTNGDLVFVDLPEIEYVAANGHPDLNIMDKVLCQVFMAGYKHGSSSNEELLDYQNLLEYLYRSGSDNVKQCCDCKIYFMSDKIVVCDSCGKNVCNKCVTTNMYDTTWRTCKNCENTPF